MSDIAAWLEKPGLGKYQLPEAEHGQRPVEAVCSMIAIRTELKNLRDEAVRRFPKMNVPRLRRIFVPAQGALMGA